MSSALKRAPNAQISGNVGGQKYLKSITVEVEHPQETGAKVASAGVSSGHAETAEGRRIQTILYQPNQEIQYLEFRNDLAVIALMLTTHQSAWMDGARAVEEFQNATKTGATSQLRSSMKCAKHFPPS